jgi:excisionase family DNA binding protein
MTQERYNSDLFLTTSQVAELLGVHPSTVKRWCNDGELAFDKTEGGHRRIHLSDALDLSRERDISTFLHPFAPFEGHVWTAVSEVVDTGSFDAIHSLAMGWLHQGQMERLAQLYLELGRHPQIPFPAFCDDGIGGFMREVGESWRAGTLRVGEEHMLTETLIEVLVQLRADARRHRLSMEASGLDGRSNGANGGNGNRLVSAGNGVRPLEAPRASRVAVVGAMEGDRHSLATHCLRVSLEQLGWEVYFLGADVPVEDFAAMQSARGADLVAISFAPPSTGADMKRCIRILSEFYDPAHPFSLALGGVPADSVDLMDPKPPFRELSVFQSITQFARAVESGFATPFTA